MPVWEAQYIIVLAAKTGWSEYFIRWELPLARGLAYYHAARLLDGEDCRWPQRGGAVIDTKETLAKVRSAIANFTIGNT